MHQQVHDQCESKVHVIYGSSNRIIISKIDAKALNRYSSRLSCFSFVFVLLVPNSKNCLLFLINCRFVRFFFLSTSELHNIGFNVFDQFIRLDIAILHFVQMYVHQKKSSENPKSTQLYTITIIDCCCCFSSRLIHAKKMLTQFHSLLRFEAKSPQLMRCAVFNLYQFIQVTSFMARGNISLFVRSLVIPIEFPRIQTIFQRTTLCP